MNVLAIGYHPDDVEIACSGTLLKCAARGDKVTVCHVANGNMGHVIIQPDELREMRIAEAKKAGSIAGFEVLTLDVGDLLPNAADKKQRDALIEVIRYAKPDFIITHSPVDYMTDHLEVQKLVFDASFSCSCPHYGSGEAADIVPIFYMDTLAGVNFVPDEFVDISDEIDLKIQMLECHHSQLDWMREHDHIDFADMVRTCSRYRGYQCGADYAEGFKMCKAYLKGTTKRLLP